MSESDGPTDADDSDGKTDADDGKDAAEPADSAPTDADDGSPEMRATRRADGVTEEDLEEIRRELDSFEDEIEDRTVHREELESDLRKYVRSRVRRGHAHGWGPYLVLLYGTAMTLGAFYFLSGGWAVLAMLVIWLSTLGLYTLMVLVGITVTAVGVPGRLLDKLRNIR